MTSEKQAEANRQNAQKSTGPKTDEGKERSKYNATIHGLTGSTVSEKTKISELYLTRMESFTERFQPTDVEQVMALELAVAASVQATASFAMLTEEVAKEKDEAAGHWDQARRLDALDLFKRIKRNPTLVVASLRETRAGCLLLIEQWTFLKEAIIASGPWDDDQAALASDLLAIPKFFRFDTSKIRPTTHPNLALYQSDLAQAEIDRINQMLDQWVNKADENTRMHALTSLAGRLSPTKQKLMRYHSEACRRYFDLLDKVRTQNKYPKAPTTLPAAPRPEPQVDTQQELRTPVLVVAHSDPAPAPAPAPQSKSAPLPAKPVTVSSAVPKQPLSHRPGKSYGPRDISPEFAGIDVGYLISSPKTPLIR